MTSREKKIPLVCVTCGNHFTASRQDAKFCSPVCSSAFYCEKQKVRRKDGSAIKRPPRKRKRPTDPYAVRGPRAAYISLVCSCCGKPFSSTREDTRYCSRECRDGAYRQTKHLRKMAELATKPPTRKRKPIPHKSSTPAKPTPSLPPVADNELVDLSGLCYLTNISRSAMYRLLEDPEFPALKIGTSLRFHRVNAIAYILHKYTKRPQGGRAERKRGP